MGIFNIFNRKPAESKEKVAVPNYTPVISEQFIVAGMQYCESNIECLRKRNPDWRKDGKTLASQGIVAEKIPQYIYPSSPVKLIEEPNNPHDKNAIVVKVAGLKVGYISRESNKHVKEILNNQEITEISAIFNGGKYKIASLNGDVVEMENYCTIRIQVDYRIQGLSIKNKTPIISPSLVDECEGSFIAVDFETTGLSRADDRIIELSAVVFEHFQPGQRFATFVNPHRSIQKQVSQVNHITNADVKNAPDEREAILSFCDFVGAAALQGKKVIVAHNSAFDMGFLSEAFKRCNAGAEIRVYDTLALSRKLIPGLENYKLGTVAKEFGIEQNCAHRAEDDALVCGEIFVHLLNEVKQRQLDKLDALSPLERDACQWIKTTLQDAGCGTEYLSFNVSTYLSVNCYGQVMRLKPRARKPYALIDKQYSVPDTMQTAPATKSEGEEYIRVFFQRPEDLEPIKDAIISRYQKVSKETDERLAAEPSPMKELADIIDRQVCI